MRKKREKPKVPGRSPMPPPGFPMRDRRRELADDEIIEEQLEFCHHCGADIPPRDGEGTCPRCNLFPWQRAALALLLEAEDAAREDCETEADHTWEILPGGVKYCVWCRAKTSAPGR